MWALQYSLDGRYRLSAYRCLKAVLFQLQLQS